MGIESDKITADVIEVSEFPEMARRYGVSGVPKTVINDQVELLGAQREATFVKAGVTWRLTWLIRAIRPIDAKQGSLSLPH
jgi:hypothetical protein